MAQTLEGKNLECKGRPGNPIPAVFSGEKRSISLTKKKNDKGISVIGYEKKGKKVSMGWLGGRSKSVRSLCRSSNLPRNPRRERKEDVEDWVLPPFRMGE